MPGWGYTYTYAQIVQSTMTTRREKCSTTRFFIFYFARLGQLFMTLRSWLFNTTQMGGELAKYGTTWLLADICIELCAVLYICF